MARHMREAPSRWRALLHVPTLPAIPPILRNIYEGNSTLTRKPTPTRTAARAAQKERDRNVVRHNAPNVPALASALLLFLIVPCTASDLPRGLPVGTGTPSVLDLIQAELPTGYLPDDFACFNKRGEVHQWIMHGADRMDRVEINISPWNERAEGYMQWKQGMIWTGTHELVPTNLGQQTMYYEAKDDCNKQLMMRQGPYFVEIHRPPKEGVSQQADPITRDAFLGIAQAVVARIAEVNDVPQSGWGGTLVRRALISASQTPAYGPAAGPRFESGQFTIEEGEKAESFQVVGGNSNVGAIYHWNSVKRHVFIRADNWASLQGLELGPGRYALSCNAIDTGIGAAGTGSLKIAFDVVTGRMDQPTIGGGIPPLIDNDPNQPPPTFAIEPVISPEPIEIRADHYLLPPPETQGIPSIQGIYTDRFEPGQSTYVAGTANKCTVVNIRTGQEIGGVTWGLGKGETIGYFTGNTFHAETPGWCWVWYMSPGTRTWRMPDDTTRTEPCEVLTTCLFRVIPGPDTPQVTVPWSTSSEQILKGFIYRTGATSSKPVSGARVTLQSDIFGGTVDPAWSAEDGSYGFTGRELGLLPAGQYQLRVYKRSEAVSSDLWNVQTEIVTLPIAGAVERNIEVCPASTKFGIDIPVP